MKRLLWALVGVVVGHDLWVLAHRPRSDRLADLSVYVGSVRGLLSGGSLYDFHAASGAPFTYPPFAGLLLVPVAVAPLPTVRVAWTCATLVAAFVLVYLFVPGRGRTVGLPLAALGLAASAPLISNLRFGQISVFVVLLALVDCLDLLPARWRGTALGLAAAIKLTPLVFVPYLWLTGRRRAAVVAVSVFAGSLAVAAVVIPADFLRWAGHEAWHTDRIGDLAQLGNQSVHGALLRHGLTGFWLPVAMLVLVMAYVRACRLDRLAGFVVVGAAGLAASPVSWTHHQFVLYFAAIPLVLSGRPWRVALGCLAAVVMILPLEWLGEARVLLALMLVAAYPGAVVVPADSRPAHHDAALPRT